MLFEKIQLEPDEEIIQITHKHWFILFLRSVSIMIVALCPLFAGLILVQTAQSYYAPADMIVAEYIWYFIYFYSAWLLCCWMALALAWTTYHLDIWVITDRRIIAIDQVSLFRRQIGSFRLEKLQDINIEINGILATFLNYGTVEAQTASGSEEEFRTKNLPHPRELKSVILKAADGRMTNQNAT